MKNTTRATMALLLAAWSWTVGSSVGADPPCFTSPRYIDESPAGMSNDGSGGSATQDMTPWLATNRSGIWAAVWASNAAFGGGDARTDYNIYASVSTDNGANWSSKVLVSQNLMSGEDYDIDPRIAMDTSGNAIVTWNRFDGSVFEVATRYCSYSGGTFSLGGSSIVVLAAGGEPDYIPMIGTYLGAGDVRYWVTVWCANPSGDDLDLYALTSADNGVNWKSSTNGGFTWTTSPLLISADDS